VIVHTRSVAGVPIAEIEHRDVKRSRTARGYSLAATTARVDEVARRFEAVLTRLLDIAALELSVRRLAEEISRTSMSSSDDSSGRVQSVARSSRRSTSPGRSSHASRPMS
jgi:hypothetical protein